MSNEITRCAQASNGRTRPIICLKTGNPCICQRWCTNDHCFKHSDVSHCKDYTPRETD